MWGKREHILYKAANLERLARNLEKEAFSRSPLNRAKPNWIETRGFEQMHYSKRSNIIWLNATEAGIDIFELCGLGGFDDEPRIVNMVCQIRAKLKRLLQKFSSPSRMEFRTGYSFGIRTSLDIAFVEIFEKFLQIWKKSRDDYKFFGHHFDHFMRTALIHAKFMRELSNHLKSKFDAVKTDM